MRLLLTPAVPRRDLEDRSEVAGGVAHAFQRARNTAQDIRRSGALQTSAFAGVERAGEGAICAGDDATLDARDGSGSTKRVRRHGPSHSLAVETEPALAGSEQEVHRLGGAEL